MTEEISGHNRLSEALAAERSQLLSDTLGQLLRARDPDSMVRQLISKIADRLGADASFSFMVNEKGEAFYLHSCAGLSEDVARSIQNLHFAHPIISGEEPAPVAIVQIQQNFSPPHKLAREAGLLSYACLPLVIGGRFLGTLGFASRSRASFDPVELEFLRIIAETQLRFQRDTLERILQGEPLPEILKRLTIDFEAMADRELVASIFLVDNDGAYLSPIASRPPPLNWPLAPASPTLEDFKTGVLKSGARASWCTPITSSAGTVLGAFAMQYRDPTDPTAQESRLVDVVTRLAAIAIERKRSEQALHDTEIMLKEHALNLEVRVNERTASLREAVAQMEEFSYSVSHDLRSPLRAMQGYASALMEDYGPKLDEQGRHFLHRIVNSSSRMERLIQDILTYSRLSRREIFPQPILLDRLLRDIIQQYPELQPPNAIIEFEALLNVTGHEPSLSQAISNLLSNAVKFVAPEVTPRVRVWTEARDHHVRLWVHDNGIGVPQQDQSRLFGMFERLHPDKKYPGTGIGLAIVRRAMDRMGGNAGMESDGANGSRFWIELPKAEHPSS